MIDAAAIHHRIARHFEQMGYTHVSVYHLDLSQEIRWTAKVRAEIDGHTHHFKAGGAINERTIYTWNDIEADINNALPHRGAEIPTEKRSTMQIEKFIRRPFEVRAVQVTPQNAAEVAQWCGGTVGKAKYKLLGSFDTELDTVIVPGSGVSQGKTFVAKIGSWVVELDGSFRVYRKRQMQEMFSRTHEMLSGELKPGDLVQDRDENDGVRQGVVKYTNQTLVDYGMLGNILHDPAELIKIEEFSENTKRRLAEEAERQGLDKINALRAAAEDAGCGSLPTVSGTLEDEPQVIDEIAGIKVGDMIRVTEEMNQFFSQEGTVVEFLNDNCLRTNMLMPNGEVHQVNHLRSEVELEEETKWVVVNNESSGQNGWVGWVVKDAPVGELVRVAFRSVNFDNNVNDRCFSYMRHELEDVSHQDLVAMDGVPSYEI